MRQVSARLPRVWSPEAKPTLCQGKLPSYPCLHMMSKRILLRDTSHMILPSCHPRCHPSLALSRDQQYKHVT